MGLAFGADGTDGRPWIREVRPGTQASKFPELTPHLWLHKINGDVKPCVLASATGKAETGAKLKPWTKQATYKLRAESILRDVPGLNLVVLRKPPPPTHTHARARTYAHARNAHARLLTCAT